MLQCPVEQFCGAGVVILAECKLSCIEVCGGEFGIDFEDSVEFFLSPIIVFVLEQEDSKVEYYIQISRRSSQFFEEIFFCLFGLLICPAGLCDTVIYLWVCRFEQGGFFPAPYRFWVLPAAKQ